MSEKLVINDKELFNQLKNIFRLKKGDEIIVFENGGDDYVSEILSIDKNSLEVMPKEKKQNVKIQEVILYQAIIKKENFELILKSHKNLAFQK